MGHPCGGSLGFEAAGISVTLLGPRLGLFIVRADRLHSKEQRLESTANSTEAST